MNTNTVNLCDLGCGTRKKESYFGIDQSDYPGVDLVQDLRFSKLPFGDGQLEIVYCSHFLEHLTFEEVLFEFNEVYRCLRIGGKFDIIVPHGASYAGIADLSHKTFWTEDTFGYFTPENHYFYDWKYLNPLTNQVEPIINKWKVHSNDATPKYEYTVNGFLENKLREIHALLEKIA